MLSLLKLRSFVTMHWFPRNRIGETNIQVPIQPVFEHKNVQLENQAVSCVLVPVIPADDDRKDGEGNTIFQFQNKRTHSPTQEMPSLYWNELAPPWLIRHMEQKSEMRQNTECTFPAKWAIPTNSILPVENMQDPDAIEVLFENPTTSDTSEVLAIENPNKFPKPSGHLHKYLNVMYLFGTAPHQYARKRDSEANQNWKGFLVQLLHKAFFCVVVSSAVLDAACQAKFHMLLFFAGEGFNQLVKFTFSMVTIATALCGAQLLSGEQEIRDTLSIMDEFEKKEEYEALIPYLAPILAVSTAIMAFVHPVFYYGMWEHSASEVIFLSSYELGQDLYIWDWKTINTTEYKIYDSFTEPNTINFLLGSLKMSRDFFSNLLMGMLWDLISTVVVVLFCWKQWFIGKHLMRVRDNVADPNSDAASNLQAAREEVWKKSKIYAGVFQTVNQVFGSFLPFFHVRHVLMCAYFLSICILPDENTTAIVYLYYLFTIVKAEIMYVISAKVDEQNGMYRKFLRNWGLHTGKIIVDGLEYDVQVLLGEMMEEPLVFGSGSFAINQRFHFGLLGLVSSLFVSLVNGIGKVSVA